MGAISLPDEFGNKFIDEQIRDAAGIDASRETPAMSGQPFVESSIEAAIWAKEPESKKYWAEVNKDIALANLSNAEEEEVRDLADMQWECKKMGLVKDAEFFRYRLAMICVSSLGRGGMAHRLLTTTSKEFSFSGGVPSGVQMQQGNSGGGWNKLAKLNPMSWRSR